MAKHWSENLQELTRKKLCVGCMMKSIDMDFGITMRYDDKGIDILLMEGNSSIHFDNLDLMIDSGWVID